MECHDCLADAYIAIGDLRHAYEHLLQIAEACPDNVAVLMRIANVACQMRNYTAMTDACEKALLTDNGNAQVYYLYAKACRAQGDITNAVAMATKAVMLRSDFDEARSLRDEMANECGGYI